MIDRFTAIFRHLLYNPHLIKADGSYSLDEIWKGLILDKVYSPHSGFNDCATSLDKYIRLYVDMRREWMQSKNT